MDLHLDFETRSEVDLKKVGLWNYANHPSTDIWCCAAALGDGPIHAFGTSLPGTLRKHVMAGGKVYAHNAQFELAIWNQIMVPRYGWPILRPEQTYCTMAMCYAMALPGALENAAAALGLRATKDTEGRALMLRMCKPLKWLGEGKPVWHWDVDTFTFMGQKLTCEQGLTRLKEYCKQDVEVERAIHGRAMPLSPRERKVWLMDYAINQRGVLYDVEAIDAALELKDKITADLDANMARVTEGHVAACTNIGALKDWAADYGVMQDSLAKAELGELLDSDFLPEPVREAFELRREAGRATSVAKLEAMRRLAGDDGRVRNMLQYHAASTGRFAGRGLQPHNFPRDLPKPEEVADIMRALKAGEADYIDMMYGAPLSVLSQLLRAFMVAAAEKHLIGGDFSNVEGRGIAWLAGEEWKLDAFRESDLDPDGPDIYERAYAATFKVSPESVTKDQRQVGKVIELACGYQGGVGAFQTMAKVYGVSVEDEVADEAKLAWRAAHPKIKNYWYRLQDCAIAAVQSPGKITVAGHPGRQVKFKKAGSFLWCLLPSARALCYPYPDIRINDFGEFLSYKSVPSPIEWGAFSKAKEGGYLGDYKGTVVDDPSNCRQWARVSTYGGKLAENVTQAICRDLLVDAMLALEASGQDIALHVHDEIITEGAFTQADLDFAEAVMNAPPVWAKDFPLAADCWLAERYQK